MDSSAHGPRVWDAEAATPAVVTARASQLRRALCLGGTGLYLLIDPMLGDPVMPEAPPEATTAEALNALRSQAWERETYALQLPARLAMDAAFAPYLVALLDATDPWLDESVAWTVQETMQAWSAEPDQSTPHRVGGWLQSAAPGHVLADTLSGWLQLKAAGAGRASYLRLADRRVLGLTVHVLGRACIESALHPVQCWSWLDAHTALCSVRGLPDSPEERGRTSAAADCPSLPALARFSPAQWAQMGLGPKVHRAVNDAVAQRLASEQDSAPAQWPPLSSAQWQLALSQAERKNKEEAQEGTHP